MTNKITAFALGAYCVATLAACSSSSPITGNSLSVTSQNGQTLATLTTTINSPNIEIVANTIQISDPNNENIGSITVTTPAQGQTNLALSLNLTDVLGLPMSNVVTTLPNGTAFPIISGATSNWVAFNVGGNNNYLYLNFDQATHEAVIGYALSSDTVSTGAAANLFYLFNAGSGGSDVTGAGGLYTGPATGQSGFAFFADFSSVIGSMSGQTVQFGDLTPANQQSELLNKVFQLYSNHAKIQIH